MIKTGRQPIAITTYLAIMSVCFVINLPGIVITPMEGRLRMILHAPELEVQLLTVLPNFVIIPFVLLTGRLSLCRHKLPWIIGSLLLYLACAIGYLFINSMTGLIIVSCLLGCANGILIPFAMGFVVNTFYGNYRTRHLGVKSATSNLAVVIGSFIVGALIEGKNWHLSFIVYLAIIFPLVFSFWLKDIPGLSATHPLMPSKVEQNVSVESDAPVKKINMPRVWGLIANNVSFSFIAMSIVIFMPQLIQNLGLKPQLAGEIVSVFFIFVLCAGFVLLPFVRLLKQYTFFGIGLFLLSGLTLITFIHSGWSFFVGSALAGIGFGFFQPFVYDKTSYTVSDQNQAVRALSYVLTALYTAIAVEPFVIEGVCLLFKIKDENSFVFLLSFFMAICYVAGALFFRKKFAFSVEKAYIEKPDEIA